MEFRVLKYSLLLALGSLLFSCTKEVKIDIPGFEEQLVVDGRIEIGIPPLVLLSKTKDIYSPTDLNSYLSGFISGATVTVSDGTNTYTLTEVCSDNLPPGSEELAAQLFGIPAEQLANYHICAYTSFNPATFGEVGKTYTLKVTYEGKSYEGSTSLLTPVAFDSTYWKPEGGLDNYGFSWATLSDPGSEYNAYYWEVKRINLDSAGNERDGSFLRTFNPVFDDEFFNGTTFDFAYENPMSFNDEGLADQYRGYYQRGDTVVIKFSRIDKTVYEYMEKKFIQIGNGGSPFAVPANIPSNMSGGAIGVWAGYSPYYDTLVCE